MTVHTEETGRCMTRSLFLSLLLLPALCCAHHSRANFDLNRVIGFKATVTRYQYTNPHSYVYAQRRMDDGTVEDWAVELGSIPNLMRMHMDGKSLKNGDVIMLRGNPEKNPGKKFMFLVSITTTDGRVFAMDDVFSTGRKIREHGAVEPGSTDFSGIWYMNFSRNAVLTGRGQPEYPVTEAGRASLARFNPDDDPFYSCINPGIPRMIGSPYALIIKRHEKETIDLDYEFPALHRAVRLAANNQASNQTPGKLGHSVGHFEGKTLVIETTGFSPETWGIGPGLDSSEYKKVIERYTLADEGRILKLHMTVTDPVYLAQPLERDYSWVHVPDYEITEYVDCNLEAAGKHLELEK